MVFVFAFVTVTPTSANSTLNTNTAYVDCVQQAIDTQNRYEAAGMSKERANHYANLTYEACVNQQ